MPTLARFRFATAWLPDGWRRDVVFAIDAAGDIVDITTEDTVTTAINVGGAAIPGMPNAHSHAFQRAMAGLAERRISGRDSFWTWRETMYELAGRMTPELLNAIATQLYADMLKAGYTSVCEFHYLHHASAASGRDNAASAAMTMSQALIDAATSSGIGLTLLPTLYQASDFGGAAPTARQRQFTLDTDQYLELVQQLRGLQHSAQLQVGIALHSLRAVPPDAMLTVLGTQGGGVVHIHVAEQQGEVDACVAHLGRRPIEWLLDHAPVDERWCLVHATHATPQELAAVVSRRAVIALCPTTEANLGDGFFPLPGYLAAGGEFAIGSDSQVSLSPCEELRWLEYQARLHQQQRNLCAGNANGSIGANLWRSACMGGARASGRSIGALAIGKRADIVVIDTDAPLFSHRSDDAIIDTLVFCGSTGSIGDVMVGGRWLVKDGRHFAETAIAAGYKRAMRASTLGQT